MRKNNVLNAGKYNRKIVIYKVVEGKDADGFPTKVESVILTTFADVKTTSGFTLIVNNSDFEKAFTNFTIRYPSQTTITRDMLIKFRDKTYTIEYINNIDEANVELEIQAKEITH